MRETIRKVGMGIVVLLFVTVLFLTQEVFAKKGGAVYTELVHDYKTVKIKVPSEDFLTDDWNYSLHFKSDKDRWAVQTTVFTRREDAENPDFLPAEKFSKKKPILIGNKYYMDVELKGLSYEITFSFTKQYKKFFEGLKEKDFIVEKDRGEEAYKNIIRNYLIFGLPSQMIEDNVLSLQNFEEYEKANKIKEAEKLIKSFKLKEAHEKKKKMDVKRQKAGILLGERLSGEKIEISLTRFLYPYVTIGYDVAKLDKGEKVSYLELKKGKKVLPILFVYNGLKKGKFEKGKEEILPGTDETLVYFLKKPL